MEEPTSYKATLNISSGESPTGNYNMEFVFDPPMTTVIEKLGEDNMPSSFQFMTYLLEKAVLPVIAMNERYEASLVSEAVEATKN